jgi:hypothetical protein
MATDWGSIGQTVISALGGGAVGAWLQGRRQASSERDQRRQRAVEVVAEVKALLTDANPGRLALNANQETFEKSFAALGERWQRIRVPLLTLWGGHPSKQVRDLARELEIATANTLIQTQWLVSDVLLSRDLDTHEEAMRWHAQATDVLNRLLEAIRQA